MVVIDKEIYQALQDAGEIKPDGVYCFYDLEDVLHDLVENKKLDHYLLIEDIKKLKLLKERLNKALEKWPQ